MMKEPADVRLKNFSEIMVIFIPVVTLYNKAYGNISGQQTGKHRDLL
jgi:hypothetical protein